MHWQKESFMEAYRELKVDEFGVATPQQKRQLFQKNYNQSIVRQQQVDKLVTRRIAPDRESSRQKINTGFAFCAKKTGGHSTDASG